MRFLRKIYNDSLLENAFYLMATNFSSLIFGFFFWVIINSCLLASIAASIMFSPVFLSGLDIWLPSPKPVLGGFELAVLFTTVTVATTVSGFISGAFKISSVVKINTVIAAITLGFPLPLMEAAYLAAYTFAAIAVVYKMKNLAGFALKLMLQKAQGGR